MSRLAWDILGSLKFKFTGRAIEVRSEDCGKEVVLSIVLIRRQIDAG